MVLVEGAGEPTEMAAALQLLDALQRLEQQFGRDRSREQRWGPRSLDLDLLFWGELRLDHSRLAVAPSTLASQAFRAGAVVGGDAPGSVLARLIRP